MSIRSSIVVAIIGLSSLAVSGCVETSGPYYGGYGGYGGYYGTTYYDNGFYNGPSYNRYRYDRYQYDRYRDDRYRYDSGRDNQRQYVRREDNRPSSNPQPNASGQANANWHQRNGDRNQQIYIPEPYFGGSGRSHQ